MASKRVIRQGQLVTPFGVGSIVDIGQESFVMADISRWPGTGVRRIEGSQLEAKLRRPIKTPMTRNGVETVAIHRFPRWLFCPRCRLMRKVTGTDDVANNYNVPTCANAPCRSELTPMGFVAACKHGHLAEFDWHWWAHSSTKPQAGKCSPQGAKLWFETTGQGGGDWSAISIRCGCGASRNFAGLVQVESPLGAKCEGKQPWQAGRGQCGESIWVYRRAASNLYFPRTISALDLQPPEGSATSFAELVAAWEADDSWRLVRTLLTSGSATVAAVLDMVRPYAERIGHRHGRSAEFALSALESVLRNNEGAGDTAGGQPSLDDTQDSILRDEWSTLSGTIDISTESLSIRRMALPEDWPPELLRTICSMSMVKRLREVRALMGFRRLSPDDEVPMIQVDLGEHPVNWFPGVEAWGEGIFVQLDASEVGKWEVEAEQCLGSRLRYLVERAERFGWKSHVATARFLLLHSLAHAVIRRLSFDAGYSAASIRERIYAGEPGSSMCGLLIYTADGDSEGSLGGLVRMGDPKRFGALLHAALLDVAWCSADPVCKETDRQGLDGMNAAACHACLLTSETSCILNNSLLDRRTLVEIGSITPFFRLDRLVEHEASGA